MLLFISFVSYFGEVCSEEMSDTVRALSLHMEIAQLDTLLTGTLKDYHAVLSEVEDGLIPAAHLLMEDFYAFKFLPFCHRHHIEGERAGEGHIYIGLMAEDSEWLSLQEQALTAELAHHLVKTLHEEAHQGISEFYDFALSWWADRSQQDYFNEGCMGLRLAHFLREHVGGCTDLVPLAEQAVTEILLEQNGREELLTYFYGEDHLRAFIKEGVLPTPGIAELVLMDDVHHQFQYGSQATEESHTIGHALAWELLLGIEGLTGLKAA